MLNRFFGTIPATRRIEEILNKFDEQIITLDDAVEEIDNEIVSLSTRVRLLNATRTRAFSVARKLRDLVSA